jgi:hypothetical protein
MNKIAFEAPDRSHSFYQKQRRDFGYFPYGNIPIIFGSIVKES